MAAEPQRKLNRSLGTWEVMVAGVALVVAATTLVSDFNGYFSLGASFAAALVMGFLINLLLGLSVADLSVAYPKAGALYEYARAVFKGPSGRFIGVFLGLSFFGVGAFAGSSEAAAGAFGLKALLHSDGDIRYFIAALYILGVIPNILGIKTMTWVSAALLVLMLGIRWFFGIAGFLGWGATGPWQAANLVSGAGPFHFTGDGGILTGGLALGIWTFVGIEFACSLAEEVKAPKRSLPRGIILGLVVILVTSLVMGLGVTGTAPLSTWQQAVHSPLGMQGEAPQLAVGRMMFGHAGYLLMALASVAATLGSFVVLFAAMPRMIYSICRDIPVLGPLSKPLGRLHPRFKTPVGATLFTFIFFIIPAFYSAVVIEWVYSAAYVWIILYMVFHLLALANRWFHPSAATAFSGRWFPLLALAGILATLTGLYYAFAGSHLAYGGRASIVIAASLILTTMAFLVQCRRNFRQLSSTGKVDAQNGGLNFSYPVICTNEMEVCHEHI
jgi:amino acid transporter